MKPVLELTYAQLADEVVGLRKRVVELERWTTDVKLGETNKQLRGKCDAALAEVKELRAENAGLGERIRTLEAEQQEDSTGGGRRSAG